MDLVGYIVISLLIVLTAYAVGRRVGYKEGFEDGKKYAPIDIKRKITTLNICPICNKPIDDKKEL